MVELPTWSCRLVCVWHASTAISPQTIGQGLGVPAEGNPEVDASQQPCQLRPALLEWWQPKILAVEFPQVKRVEDGTKAARRRWRWPDTATPTGRTQRGRRHDCGHQRHIGCIGQCD